MKEFGPFRLDLSNQCLWRFGESGRDERILLTPKAFGVLRYLVEHAGTLVTHEELLEAVWPHSVVEPQAVKKHVLEVRYALGDRPKNSLFIETVIRRGYRFIAPVAEHHAASAASAEKRRQRGLVGRDRELDVLHELFQHATQGERQIVLISGEPGIGKTAITDEFRAGLASSALSIHIAQGQCVEGYGGKEPYYPILDALGRLCRGPHAEAIVQILAEQAPTWLIQFPALLKPHHREALQRELLGATRERMLREIGEALESITAESPLLLVLEDLQWVDDSTVDLLSALARRKAPAKLMLLATCRPLDAEPSSHPFKAVIRDLLVHRLCREIALSPLTEADVEHYLTAGSSATSAPAGLPALLHRHSEGNPLFMVAALDHMVKRSLLSRSDGVWQLNVPLRDIELAVPDDLRQMIEAQLERLSTEERSTLELASIAGASFCASVIDSSSETDAPNVEDVCEELSRRGQIVRWEGTEHFPDDSTSERYAFLHALYRQVLYERQAPGRRARLHRHIGERLESIYSHRVDEIAAEVAYHFEAAADWPRAVEYLARAAEVSAHRYAHAQAEAILERALEIVRKLPEAQRADKEIALLDRLASSRAAALDMHAIDTYQMLSERAAQYGLLDTEVDALIRLSHSLSLISSERCLEAVQRALNLSTRQSPAMRARTRASCAFHRLIAGGWSAEASQDFRDAVAEMRERNDVSGTTSHLVAESHVRWLAGEYREAHRLALESRAHAVERGGLDIYRATVLPNSLFYLGKWGEALRALASGTELAEKNEDYHVVRWLRLLLAGFLLFAQDFKGVLGICREILPEALDAHGASANSPITYLYEQRLASISSASAAAGLGDYAYAHEKFEAVRRTLENPTTVYSWYQRMRLEGGIAELSLATGDLTRARRDAELFLATSLTTEERTWQALAWETNARVALGSFDLDRARSCIDKALSTVQAFEVPLAAWRVRATAARIEEESRNWEAAESHFAASRAMILQIADSLAAHGPLRDGFLSAPVVAGILAASSDAKKQG